MQLFRRVIAVLLMISLPAYGWAFSAMPTCSMQHGAMPASNAAAAKSGMHGCCAEHQAKQDAKSLYHSDHSDRSGHGDAQCQCSGLYQAVQPLTALIIPTAHSIIQSSPFQSITNVVLPLWRPPTVS